MRKKALVAVLVLVAMLSMLVFAACDNDTPSVTVSIADKSVTEVYEGHTLQLSANKNPESTEVVWASSDTAVATVSENGLVTGVSAGTATISVSVGSEVKDSIEITVRAYTVDISDDTNAVVYITRTVQLTASRNPADATVEWSSSNEDVATVSADGVVTGIGAGTAVITAACGNATDSITVTVKDTVINTAINADKFDMSGLYQDNAVISSSDPNSFAVFNGEASQYYVASATVKVTAPSGSNTWSRVAISHYNGEKHYGLMLSPGPDFAARKTVTMVIDAEGNVEWGTVTDRSQVWNRYGVSSINFDEVTLTSVRSGNEFYAFINGELYYYENGIDGFTDVNTLPVLHLADCTAEFSAMEVTYGQEGVEEYLATADDAMFYVTDENVVIGEDGSIKFSGASDSTAPGNPKDHAAKGIGAKAVLPADEEATITFDLTIDEYPVNPGAVLAVTMNRYDALFREARSLLIGQTVAGWAGWNSDTDMPLGDRMNYSLNGEGARLEVGETYHITITRLMTETGQDNALTVADSEGNILFEGTWGWNNDGYTGRAYLSFLCDDLDCTISNLVIA